MIRIRSLRLCALAMLFLACSSCASPQVTYRIEMMGLRTAVENADVEFSPPPSHIGDLRWERNRFVRAYDYDIPLQTLLDGIAVTIVSRRANQVVSSTVLAPYLCAEHGDIDGNSDVMETHEVEIDAAGALFVDSDSDASLFYRCEVSWNGGADGEGSSRPEARPPRCDDPAHAGTSIQFTDGNAATSNATRCQLYDLKRYSILYAEFSGEMVDGRNAGVIFSVCATAADVPFERTVAELKASPCAHGGINAYASTGIEDTMARLDPIEGSIRFDSIEDTRNGKVTGTVDVMARAASGEMIRIAGPFAMPTLRVAR